ANLTDEPLRAARGGQRLDGKPGAPFFVVRGVRIVYRVMEPDRHFDCGRGGCLVADGAELGKAFAEMGQIMIGAMALAVTFAKVLVTLPGFSSCPSCAPQAGPTGQVDWIHLKRRMRRWCTGSGT